LFVFNPVGKSKQPRAGVVGGAAEKVGGEVCSEVVGACGGGALEFKTAVSFYFVDQASRLRLIWLQSGGKSW